MPAVKIDRSDWLREQSLNCKQMKFFDYNNIKIAATKIPCCNTIDVLRPKYSMWFYWQYFFLQTKANSSFQCIISIFDSVILNLAFHQKTFAEQENRHRARSANLRYLLRFVNFNMFFFVSLSLSLSSFFVISPLFGFECVCGTMVRVYHRRLTTS